MAKFTSVGRGPTKAPVAAIVLAATALVVWQAVASDSVGNWVRETVLVRNVIPVGARHLRYAPADDDARNGFMLGRGEVEVVVPWRMTGQNLVDLYGVQSLPNAVAAIRSQAGSLRSELEQGDSFSIPLN